MQTSQIQPAVDAAVSSASELGLSVEDASVIQNSNRLAVRLLPCDVLARVAASVRRNHEGAAFEVEMARQLEAADCPIAVLEPRVEPRVHVRDGFAITYWTYYEPVPASDTTLAEYAQTLERLHAGMRRLDAPAPHFTDRVEEAHSIVRDRSQSPELIDADRDLLTHVVAQPSPGRRRPRRGRAAVARRTARRQSAPDDGRYAVHRPGDVLLRAGRVRHRPCAQRGWRSLRTRRSTPASRLPDPHACDDRRVASGSGR